MSSGKVTSLSTMSSSSPRAASTVPAWPMAVLVRVLWLLLPRVRGDVVAVPAWLIAVLVRECCGCSLDFVNLESTLRGERDLIELRSEISEVDDEAVDDDEVGLLSRRFEGCWAGRFLFLEFFPGILGRRFSTNGVG